MMSKAKIMKPRQATIKHKNQKRRLAHDDRYFSKKKKMNDWKKRGSISKAKVVKTKLGTHKKVSEYPTKDLPLQPLLTEKDALKW